MRLVWYDQTIRISRMAAPAPLDTAPMVRETAGFRFTHLPPTADEIAPLMKGFVAELNMKSQKLHPVTLAAYAHRRLLDIHPFIDGNGRTARLLMNLILVNKGYQIVVIPPILRMEYIAALHEAQRSRNPSDKAFFQLIAECEIESQKDYCRMFRIDIP